MTQYTVQENFLDPTTYWQLKYIYNNCLGRGLSDASTEGYSNRFTKFKTYDAYSLALHPDYSYPADVRNIVHSPERIAQLEREFDVELTLDVTSTFHYLKPNFKTGWIHTDNEAVFFLDRPNLTGPRKGINYNNRSTNNRVATPDKIMRRRSVTCILYLNDNWQEGDGGETVLYNTKNVDDVLAAVKPRGNTLLTFKIDEQSFHRSVTSTKERKLMIWWYHSTAESGVNLLNSFLPGGIFANGG